MIRIDYYDVAVGAAEDASITAAGCVAFADPSRLPFGSNGTGDIIQLAHNNWTLDGTRVPRDGIPVSYMTAAQSNSSCNFTTQPTITIELDNQYTAQGLTLFFLGDAWCSALNIKWYRGNTQLASENYSPTGLTAVCEKSVTAFNKIVITLNSTSLPNRRLMLDKILFGLLRSFGRGEFRSGSVKVIQEIDPTSRSIVANSMDIRLSSQNPVDYIFQYRQPMYAYDGDQLIGAFYVAKAERQSETLYDIACTDAVGLMDDDVFPDTAYLSGINAYALAQTICQGYPLTMDASLQSKTVTGVIVGQTRRGALQKLCIAIGAVADTSNDMGIKIFPLEQSTAKVIPASRARTPSVAREPTVTAVMLAAHSYNTIAGDEEITINGVKYYDTKTITTITNPTAVASDKPNVISIEDATLVSSDNVGEIAQWLFDELTRSERASLKFHVNTEVLGDLVTIPTLWGDSVTGHYIRGSLTLSSFILSDAEVLS